MSSVVWSLIFDLVNSNRGQLLLSWFQWFKLVVWQNIIDSKDILSNESHSMISHLGDVQGSLTLDFWLCDFQFSTYSVQCTSLIYVKQRILWFLLDNTWSINPTNKQTKILFIVIRSFIPLIKFSHWWLSIKDCFDL